MKVESWKPAFLPALVRFWNRAFASKRNYFPVTGEILQARILRKRTAVEAFDPAGFLVARAGKDVVGLIHVGERSEALVRSLDPEWPGGAQGYVAFLYVEPGWRQKGLGSELWHQGLDRLKKTRQVVLDGQCWNPFYGNSEGPFTPLWGTPEGVSVEWDSSATKKFLARKGFAPRFKGVQLSLDAPPAPPSLATVERALGRGGFELRLKRGVYPELGKPEGEHRYIPRDLEFQVASAVQKGRTVGLIVSFPLREVRTGLHAIYEANVLEPFRGRALGKNLLSACLHQLAQDTARSVEVLTIPEVSPAAHKLYLSAGFTPVASWAVY
jgi:ribosomal protein S18 acetylase RimI-like enzyme